MADDDLFDEFEDQWMDDVEEGRIKREFTYHEELVLKAFASWILQHYQLEKKS